MQRTLAIAITGLTAVLLHRLRSVAITGCVVAVVLPYLVGVGISRGLQDQAEDSVRFGADLYVTGRRFGRVAPIPIELAEAIRCVTGVIRVIPRIVGPVTLGKDRENVVLVGLPVSDLPDFVRRLEGRLFRPGSRSELVIGTELAKRLRLKVGSLIPPFYQSRAGDRVSQVVGVFTSDVPIWQSRLILTSLENASNIFDERGVVTDLLVYCDAGHAPQVVASIRQIAAESSKTATRDLSLRVLGREDLDALLPKGLLHREGVFNLHFLLAFVVAAMVVLVTSELGLSERRKEVGILKATGWLTDEILLRSVIENLVLCLVGTSLSIGLAFGWLEWFNGYWIASVFLAGADTAPSFDVPFRIGWVPAGLALLISFVVVQVGTLWGTWRTAIAPPAAVLR